MNKIFYILLIFAFSGIFNFIAAQHCSSPSGSFVCNATGGPVGGGFENPDSVPCVIQGVPYDTTIQLTMYSQFFAEGSEQTVDSIEFVSIENLPCGLCWSSNSANNRFSANEYGCIRIQGTTSDSSGQYQLSITLDAWINGSSLTFPVPPAQVTSSGIKMYVRVQMPSGSCTPVDTSSSAPSMTASCVTAISELNAIVPNFSIFPNPINSTATLTFTSQRNTRYTLNITDLTGRLISTSEVTATAGQNKLAIERGAKAAGVYFVSLSDGRYSVTNRFTVLE